jgi:hypothetical protein
MIKIEAYHALWQKRSELLRRGIKNSKVSTAKFVEAKIRSMAPRKSGALIRSIKRTGSSVSVSGRNPYNGFPYVHWVNRTKGTGMRTLHFKNGIKATYGLTPSWWNYTGIGNFFGIAVDMGRVYHINMQRTVLETAI